MSKQRWVYYGGFPAVVLVLCAFSYFLGLKRGEQRALRGDVTKKEAPISSKSPATEKEKLTFYKTLRASSMSDVSRGAPQKKKEVPRKPLSEKPKKKGVVVQMSAFRDIGKAHELIDELKNRGYRAFTAMSGDRGNTWHRVYVGPFRSRDEADEKLAELAARGLMKGFVTNLK